MTPRDPNIARVELVAAALGSLRERLVFVGGCAAGLLISDPAATPVRATFDVDLVVQVAVLSEYHRVEMEFEKLGFQRDMTREAPVCRWRYRTLEVDLMPSKPEVIGFANRWYPLAMNTSQPFELPSGLTIRLIDAPAFIGTKFEAFADRGKGDLLASHDLEDILNVVAGRHQLLDEIEHAPTDLRQYLADRCGQLLTTRDFEYFLPGLLQDETGVQSDLVLERLRSIVKLGR